MRLHGYRPHAVLDGVEVWESVPFEVPIKQVIRDCLVSAAVPPWTRGGAESDDDEPPPPGRRHGPIGYRRPDGGECRIAEGLVVASSPLSLIEFLRSRYVPLADGPIEELSRRAAGREHPTEWFEDAFRRDAERLVSAHRANRSVVGRYGSRRGYAGPLSPVVLCDGEHEPPGVRIEAHDGPRILLTADHVVLSRESTATRRGLAIPRRAWALVSRYPTEPVLFWDGDRAGCVSPGRFGRTALHESLDRDGTSLSETPICCIGAPELEPLFLLRVPPADEFEAATERVPDDPAFRNACLLFDSRAAVPLPPDDADVPVVTDPGVARFLVTRTTPSGVYVPNAPSCRALPRELAGTVQVGALPRLP
jgi:hypothetical protein